VTDQPDYIECGTVRLGADGAAEMDGTRKLMSIPRADVIRIELLHGSASERPLLSLILGLILLAISIAGPMMLAGALLGRGRVEVKFVTSIAFIVPAAWLLDLVIRRRWFLRVHTTKGSRKLIFKKGCDPVALEQFVMSAKERFGYS